MPTKPYILVEDSIKLSSLPEICFRINEVVGDPQSSFEDIAEVISNDTSLSVRLLKIVNSAFYNFPEKIETIIHAISIVGTQQVQDLALATSALTVFKGIPGDFFNMSSFWRHSVGCGIAARTIAIHRREPNPERFYLMGILHDVGRLLIFENMPDMAREIVLRSERDKEIMYEVESEILGFDHAAVGADLLRAWNLPDSIEEVVAYHHRPLEATRYPMECAVLHAADFIAKAMELGCSGDPLVPPLNEDAWEEIGLSASQLPAIWDQVEAQYNDTVEMFLSLIKT